MNLEKFVYDFGFKVTNIKHHDPYSYIDRYNGPSRECYTKYDIDTTFEMEITQRDLERMADYFQRTDEVLQKDFDERLLRRDNPALEEAYSKYRMLLELYK
jgi:hypothetical protein